MKRNIFFANAILLILNAALFAEVTVINPVAGTFANTQTLVIEAGEGEEVYYSFSGSDPLVSGFAYDGPVLLDVTGAVELRVASVDAKLKRKEKKVSYTVNPASTQNEEHAVFISSLETGAVAEYVAGNKIAIPFTMNYYFGDSGVFENGKEISISKKSAVERYLPFTFTDGKNLWRYVLHVSPSEMGLLSRRDVPFKITDWTKLTFTDPKLIYSTDGEWWHSFAEVVTLDRSVINTIYYQSADYSPRNEVTKIVLPPKPALKVERQYDGEVMVSIAEDSVKNASVGQYKLSPSTQAKKRLVAQGLYSQIFLDTFPGDKIEELIPFDVYYSNVYQGTLFASVELSRATPNLPSIKTSAKSFYSRENVEVSASAPKKLKIYVGLSDPVEVQPSQEIPDLSTLDFKDPTFSLYDGNTITFFADTERALAYKVLFYSEDEFGMKSPTASYSVIVDKYNYYVDASSTVSAEDGTPFAPFKDLSRLSKIVNANEFSRFCIKGETQLSLGESSLASNVEFVGMDEAKILVPENSVLIVKNAGLYAKNITWEKILKNTPSKKPRAAAKALTNMLVIDNSAATFSNCEILCNFAGDGTTFNLTSSVLNLDSAIIVNNAQGYSSVVGALSSKIKIFDSRILCVSDTAVALSVNGGSFDLSNTFVQVTARMARVAELIDTTAVLENNNFTAELSSPKANAELVYKTSGTKFLKDEGNIIR